MKQLLCESHHTMEDAETEGASNKLLFLYLISLYHSYPQNISLLKMEGIGKIQDRLVRGNEND